MAVLWGGAVSYEQGTPVTHVLKGPRGVELPLYDRPSSRLFLTLYWLHRYLAYEEAPLLSLYFYFFFFTLVTGP